MGKQIAITVRLVLSVFLGQSYVNPIQVRQMGFIETFVELLAAFRSSQEMVSSALVRCS